MTKHKILSPHKLASLSKRLKSKSRKIVFTNGTFDILHIGHIRYLEQARKLGDVLVVGVNSDVSVRSYKGQGRPINPEKERLQILAALECVSYVTRFSDPTPLKLIRACKPDVLVKGGDWKLSQIVGAKEVLSWGGKVKRLPFVPDRSTTRVIQKLRQAHE